MAGRTNRRWVVEFIVLVVGVFLALAAESWLAGSQARAYEKAILSDMIAEFQANIDILDDDLAENDSIISRLQLLGAMDRAQLRSMSPSEADAHLGASANLMSAGFDPSMGAAQALVQSGDLGLISDPSLRGWLAAWAALLEERQRFNQIHTQFMLNSAMPRLAQFGSGEVWTAEERTEAQTLLFIRLRTLENIDRNQSALREVAVEVLALLKDAAN